MRGQVIGAPGKVPASTKNIKMEVQPIERLVEKVNSEIKTNETIVLTIGTMPAVGTVGSYANGKIEVFLNSPVVIEKGQKIALSRKESTRWRLVAFGVVQ